MRADTKLVAVLSLVVLSIVSVLGFRALFAQGDADVETDTLAADRTGTVATTIPPISIRPGLTRPTSIELDTADDSEEWPTDEAPVGVEQPPGSDTPVDPLVVVSTKPSPADPTATKPPRIESKEPSTKPRSSASGTKRPSAVPTTTITNSTNSTKATGRKSRSTAPPITSPPSTGSAPSTSSRPGASSSAPSQSETSSKDLPKSVSSSSAPAAVEPVDIGEPVSTAAPTTQQPVVSPPPVASRSGSGTFRVTVGSSRSTPLDTSSPSEGEAAHGTRLYCPVSHFSHDDPVVFPGQVGAAHAHMFWGNTEADAFSNGATLLASGNSSCEGGTNNRSSYWMPTLMNSSDEVMLPEEIIVYYKSFGGPGFDRNTIRSIPTGLELLATKNVANAQDNHFRVSNHGGEVELFISFPQCLRANGSEPVLSSADNIAHLSYSSASDGTSNTCPRSHPYRIPQISYRVRYRVPFASAWYLSSDKSSATKGQSLHADYIAAWDSESMSALVDCNIKMKRECQFAGVDGGGQKLLRSQLPERFNGPDNNPIYQHSVGLLPQADRTPFGTSIGKHTG